MSFCAFRRAGEARRCICLGTNMKKRVLLLGAAAAICALPAFAQDAEEKDELVVTGTRFATPLDQVGRSVSVITAEDIDLRQQRFVFDALSAAPGVQVIRSGSFGGVSSVSIRGLPSGQTLSVQDGVVLNDPTSFNNSFNFANFDTGDIARIEILRGAQSTLYGSDAIGGVINIVTSDGRDGFGGDAYVEGGSFGTFRGSASLRGGNETASGRFTVSGVTTDGYSAADEADGNTEDDGFNNVTLSAKTRYAPSEALEFSLVARYQDARAEFDDFLADADKVSETEALTVAGFATHTSFGGMVENRVGVTYLYNDRFDTEPGAVSFDGVGERISYEYQGTFKPAQWLSVIAGAEYDVQDGQVDIGFGASQEVRTASGFGLVQLQPVEFVTLNAGVRHDASTTFSDETTFSVSAAVQVPLTGAILRGSYAEGFRAPTASELAFNPDLLSQFSEGWDIGVEQPLWNGRASVSVTYFDQEIDNLIAFDFPTERNVNIALFASEGVEVAMRADIVDWLSFSGAYTYVDALNVSSGTSAAGQPEHRFNAELAFRPTERFAFSTGVTFNGRETFFGPVVVDSFTLVNIRGQYALSDRFELFARVENVTDADYQDNFGFGTAPVSAYGGVRARF